MDACLLLLCLICFSSTKPRDWLRRTSPNGLFWVGWDVPTSTQSVNPVLCMSACTLRYLLVHSLSTGFDRFSLIN